MHLNRDFFFITNAEIDFKRQDTVYVDLVLVDFNIHCSTVPWQCIRDIYVHASRIGESMDSSLLFGTHTIC